PITSAHTRQRLRRAPESKQDQISGLRQAAPEKPIRRRPGDFLDIEFPLGEPMTAKQLSLSLRGCEHHVIRGEAQSASSSQATRQPNRVKEQICIRLERSLREQHTARLQLTQNCR